MIILVLIPFFFIITYWKEYYILSLFILLIVNGAWFSAIPLNTIGPSIYLSDIYILSSIIISILYVYSELMLKGHLRLSMIGFALTIFFFVFIINVFRGIIIYGHSAYGVARTSGFYVLNSVVAYFYLNRNFKLSRIINLLKFLAWLSLVVSVIIYIQNLLTNHPEPHRAFGTLRTLFIAFYFMFLIFNKSTGNLISNKNTYITLIILGFAILISSQRAIWLAMIFTILILIANLNFKALLKVLFFIIIPIVIISILVLSRLPMDNLIAKNINNRIEGVINPEKDLSSSTRLISWYVAFSDFIDNPIIGEGVGEREEIMFNFENFEAKSEFVMTHNYYLTVAEQRGLLGLLPLLFVMFIYLILYFKRGKHIRKSHFVNKLNILDQYFLLMVVFISVYMFFWNDQPIVWIIIGISLAISEKKRKLFVFDNSYERIK